MSLFGSLFKGIAGVIPGVSSIFNSNAISKANKATQAGIQQGVSAINANLAQANTNYSPYISGGKEATEAERRLLGLGDSNTGTASNPYTAGQQQEGALSLLKDSPLFKSIFNTGQEAVLQNNAATGGVRGGNVQTALAENGENTFASVLQNYLSQLGSVAGQGLTATGGLANVGTSSANSLVSLFDKSGSANAGSILGQQAVANDLSQKITSALAAGFGGGGGFSLSSALTGLGGAKGSTTNDDPGSLASIFKSLQSGSGGLSGLSSIFSGPSTSTETGATGVNNIASVLQQSLNANNGSVFTRGF